MNVKELFSLKNKIILITGGIGNFGKCIVEGLTEADVTVITASRNILATEKVAKAFRNNKLDVYAMQLDQSDHSSVLTCKDKITKSFGSLNVFVNNAVSRPMKGYDAPIVICRINNSECNRNDGYI